MTIIERALELVTDGSRVGLGSGRAARAFVKALGERVRKGGLRVRGVPTSEETAVRCASSGNGHPGDSGRRGDRVVPGDG